MKPLFSVGPISIYFFGLMIAFGSIAGLLLFIREAKRKNLNHKLLTDLVLYSFVGGIVGARIVYILVYNPLYYLNNPLQIFFIYNGGLSIHGGIIGGLLVGYLLLKRNKQPIWQTFDLIAPALILAQGISRIGCDVFGSATTLPWGVELNGELLHPAQAYEFILDYLLFGYLWLRLKKPSYNGQVFLHYLIGYLLIRGIVEFSRINPIVFGPFSVSHVMSLIGITIALFYIRHQKKDANTENRIRVGKGEYVKTALVVVLLIIISLILYYGVRG